MNRVQLDEITIVNFRNFEKAVVRPGPRFNIVSGRNGMGKTNLLESIYLMGSLRSFRTSAKRDLVKHEATTARVSGVFGEVCAGLTCEITIGPDGRKVRMGGKAAGVEGDHFRTLPMVLFHPGIMELVQGGPEARRRFIDRALFQAEQTYPSLHRSYGKALASRNLLLRGRSVDRRALEPFDIQMARLGARICEMRSVFVQSMRDLFEEAIGEVSEGGSAGLEYRPKVEGGEAEISTALEANLAKDIERGYTSIGPHADDIVFAVNGKRARKFASQGQQRTVVLSLKIAETRTLAQRTGRIPLLLLDDVSSELDRGRNKHLFEFLRGVGGQVFITTTHVDHIPIEDERTDFVVDEGRVSVG